MPERDVNMRDYYDEQLKRLDEEVIHMGYLIKNAISRATAAFVDLDVEEAKKIIAGDSEVDHQEKVIENLTMKLLLKQQPVASDLRKVSAALKMVTDMERIGDNAADISEIALTMADSKTAVREPAHIRLMTEETIQMLTDSITAYTEKDVPLAQEVIERDDVVDGLFDKVKEEIVAIILDGDTTRDRMVDYLMVAKYLERIGDHAVNIAEWVIFMVTGEHK